jgi:general secretion pathway protein D
MKLRFVVALLAGAGCSATERAYEAGTRLALAREWDAAVAHYREALEREPENLEYRMTLQRALLEASHAHLKAARERRAASDLPGAASELEIALGYDSTNRYAAEELEGLRREMGTQPAELPAVGRERLFGPEPVLDPGSDELLDLRFAEETSLRAILQALGRLSGVNVLFDESFRDKPVTVDLEGLTFLEALELLLSTNGLFYKVVDSSTVSVSPEPP